VKGVFPVSKLKFDKSSIAGLAEDAADLTKEPELLPELFKPIRELVAIQLLPRSRTEKGIYLPDTSKVKTSSVMGLEGYIVAVGPKVQQLKRGDRVLVPDVQQPTVVRYKGHDLLMAVEGWVLGVISSLESTAEEKADTIDAIELDDLARKAADAGYFDASATFAELAAKSRKMKPTDFSGHIIEEKSKV
jgi:co-chaperonin GroES (HSP10)